MNRRVASFAVCLAVLTLASPALANERRSQVAPLTGTWECSSHGGSRGDMPFTLTLEQANEVVTGSVSSPLGSTELTSATYKNKMLEIHIDTDRGNYLLTGKLKDGQLSGEWSRDTEKGRWEGRKQAATTH